MNKENVRRGEERRKGKWQREKEGLRREGGRARDGILFSQKKEGNPAVCNNIVEVIILRGISDVEKTNTT